VVTSSTEPPIGLGSGSAKSGKKINMIDVALALPSGTSARQQFQGEEKVGHPFVPHD
jgi:hypothetical protein